MDKSREYSIGSLDGAGEHLQLQILSQIPTPVMAVDANLKIIYMNESGSKLIGRDMDSIIGKQCADCFSSNHCNTDECCMIKAINERRPFTARNEVDLGGEKLPIEYYAVPLFDDQRNVIGGLEYILDISERVLYEKKLREQSYTIQQMSTPTIKLWEGILLLPVVGVIDSLRAQSMMEGMLNKIAETYSKVIILDIHGVAAVDTAVANHLIKITKATKLMGCECILSGISPAVAQTIIQLGINMQDIMTKSTLSDALDEALITLGLKVVDED